MTTKSDSNVKKNHQGSMSDFKIKRNSKRKGETDAKNKTKK